MACRTGVWSGAKLCVVGENMAVMANPVTRNDAATDTTGQRGLRAVGQGPQPRVSFSRLVGLLDYANSRSQVSHDVTKMEYVAGDGGSGLSRRVMGVTQSGYAVPLSKEMVQRALDAAGGDYISFLVGGAREEMVVYGDSCLGVHHSKVAVSAVLDRAVGNGVDPLLSPPVNAFGATGKEFVRGVIPDSAEVYLQVPTNMQVMDGGQRFTPWRVALEHALSEVVR